MEARLKKYEFEALIKASEIGSGGAYIEFPFDVEKEFGVKGRVKIVCFFDNIEYRGSLVKMGTQCHIIGITKEIRNKIGKNIGDSVKVLLYKDESEREIKVHPTLLQEFEKDKTLQGIMKNYHIQRERRSLTN
ncbi:MAG TPA: DUF1905 domain-containing protein [Bacteroidales bacterium]|nr:DUF1905 domain-containing protein [Bacteroidales bacterium]